LGNVGGTLGREVVGRPHGPPGSCSADTGLFQPYGQVRAHTRVTVQHLLNVTLEIPSREAASPTLNPRSASTSSRRISPECTGFLHHHVHLP